MDDLVYEKTDGYSTTDDQGQEIPEAAVAGIDDYDDYQD